METVGVIQETYNVWSWLSPLISGAIGALIGTYGGSYFLHWKQEKKIKNVRSMAVKALDIFKEYAQHKKNYADSANEFNTKLNVSEKRAVVVALHKIGVPFEVPARDTFDIKNIRFKDVAIITNIYQGLPVSHLPHFLWLCVHYLFPFPMPLSEILYASAH